MKKNTSDNKKQNNQDQQVINSANGTNNEDVRATEVGEIIKKIKNGIDYVGDVESPEEQEKYEKEDMSQSGG
ncbi:MULTISPECIES: hypothetical protein [unclassified Staphylococcus]|uniref:hypothetical protein n=1 Tax=Staphylococcus TaxID=1279 RepID=UPI00085BF4B9|nr:MULTISPECIES: hypothetical protein [unclassified Staphylococcus]SCS91228.1 Uncharacterised protein [Staphylococcus cohnii subsp. cohnii]